MTPVRNSNGAGIPARVIDRVLDFEFLISDKAVYRSPNRGQQGNAVKTVIGVASVLGGHPVVVEACGLRHTVSAELIGSTVDVTHRQAEAVRRHGTRVVLTVDAAEQDFSLDGLVARFALANPHVKLSMIADSALTTRLPAWRRSAVLTCRP